MFEQIANLIELGFDALARVFRLLGNKGLHKRPPVQLFLSDGPAAMNSFATARFPGNHPVGIKAARGRERPPGPMRQHRGLGRLAPPKTGVAPALLRF